MAQIEIAGAREREAWSGTRIALRRSRGRLADPRRSQTFTHEGRGLLLPLVGWARAGHDGALRTSPIQFR